MAQYIYKNIGVILYLLFIFSTIGILLLRTIKLKKVIRIPLIILFSLVFIIVFYPKNSKAIDHVEKTLVSNNIELNSYQKEPIFEKSLKKNSSIIKLSNTKSKKKTTTKYKKYNGVSYKIIKVDGGDLSGERLSSVAVNIGYGDREYWAFTNKYGQLKYVTAKKIILQDDKNEPVLSNGRYYRDEAKVPGTELEEYDEGHIIADSLGGVSNAYNITPQESTLNRHGDQAYMEKAIRDAGGCKDFVATISYSNTKTQIPSHYKYEYTLKGNKIVDEFDNINPDKANEKINKSYSTTTEKETTSDKKNQVLNNNSKYVDKDIELSRIDKNKNSKVTIAEAKGAGYKMPIKKGFWLYEYMDDRDGDGIVGE